MSLGSSISSQVLHCSGGVVSALRIRPLTYTDFFQSLPRTRTCAYTDAPAHIKTGLTQVLVRTSDRLPVPPPHW